MATKIILDTYQRFMLCIVTFIVILIQMIIYIRTYVCMHAYIYLKKKKLP